MKNSLIYLTLVIAIASLYTIHIQDRKDIDFLTDKVDTLYKYAASESKYTQSLAENVNIRLMSTDNAMLELYATQKKQRNDLLLVEQSMYIVIGVLNNSDDETKVKTTELSATDHKIQPDIVVHNSF